MKNSRMARLCTIAKRDNDDEVTLKEFADVVEIGHHSLHGKRGYLMSVFAANGVTKRDWRRRSINGAYRIKVRAIRHLLPNPDEHNPDGTKKKGAT